MRYRFACLLFILFHFASLDGLQAQQAPQLGYVFPPCGAVGTTIDVKLGGYDFTPDTQFFVLDDRITLELLSPPGEMLYLPPPYWFGPKARNKAFPVPREVPARITIPDGYPAGIVHWQAANANGATVQGQFLVIDDANIVIESRESFGRLTNDQMDPQTLPALPVTVCGCLQKKEEIDSYLISVKEDALVTCRIPTLQCGFPIHAVVTVTDSSGRKILNEADTQGTGLALTFAARQEEVYTLSVRDLDYRGDRSMVYQMSLDQGPLVLVTVPAMGQRGTSQTVEFIGYGVATGKAQLESTTSEVQFPEDTTQSDYEYRLETPFGRSAPVRFRLSDSPQLTISNLSDSVPRLLTSSGTTLIMDRSRKEFIIDLQEGQNYSIDVIAQQIGSPLDVSIEILDSNNKVVASHDDLPDSTDASITFQPKSTGEFRLVVQDLSGQAGKQYSTCHVGIRSVSPSIELKIPEFVETVIGDEPVEIDPKKKLKKGQRGALLIEVVRHGGYEGDVAITLEGAPDGVNIPSETIVPANAASTYVPIWCDVDAASLASMVSVVATANYESGSVSDEARTLIAPIIKPRAVVRPLYPDAGRTVHRGATYQAPVVIERLEEFDGEIELQMAAHPDRVRQGISGSDIVVAPGVNQIDFPLFLPEWVQTDRTSRIILNTIVKIPDGQGNHRHLVNRMDRRITMNVEGALMKLTPIEFEFTLGPKESIQVPLDILRNSKFQGPVQVSIAPDPVQADLFSGKNLTVSAGDNTATIEIFGRPEIDSFLKRWAQRPDSNTSKSKCIQRLHIRAVGQLKPGTIVQSTAEIEVCLN